MNKKGFTLVEIIAVIVVIAIILAVALPRVLDQFAGYRGDLDAKQKDILIEVMRGYVNENLGSFPEGNSTVTPPVSTVCCVEFSYLLCRGALHKPFFDNLSTSVQNDWIMRVIHDGIKHTIEPVPKTECTPAACPTRTC